jgi:putative ABC transport system permease protein
VSFSLDGDVMSLLSAIRVALGALLVNKTRTALTSLGIVIGISAVIALVSAGEGARHKLDERLTSVGKNLIIIRPGARTSQGQVADFAPLALSDVTALKQQLKNLLTGVAANQLTQRVASTSAGSVSTTICGATPDLAMVRQWTMRTGRFFSEDDEKRQATVCILGETVRKKLFPNQVNPVGQTLRVERLQLRVIGVLKEKGRSPTGGDQDDQIMTPLSTLQRKLVGEERLNSLLTAVPDEGMLEQAKREITRILRERHHCKPGAETFDVASVNEIAELARDASTILQGLVAVIASISLVVGGIGIMNIMLVSVTERTREIGLRMAVGATPLNVLTQFLLEAVVLSLLGGLIGIGLGLGAALGLAVVAKWPLIVSPSAVLIACGVSASVGVFFGYYPAWKASRLDPIEALRYE